MAKTGFRWADLSSRKSEALRDGLIGALIGGVLFGLIGGLAGGRIAALNAGRIYVLISVLSYELVNGVFFGLIVGLIVGLTRLFTAAAIPETHSVVNEGTHCSIRMALFYYLIFDLIGGLFFWLIYGLFEWRGPPAARWWLTYRLALALVGGLFFGLIAGLISGGMFALKHFVVRLFLWKSGSAPLHYVAFLAQARDLLLLRQVSGGYIFVHRLLREYFVSLAGSEKTTNTSSAT